MDRGELFEPGCMVGRERRRAGRLDDGQARQAVDQADRVQLDQRLAERGCVAEIATWQHDPVGRLPAALLEHLEDDRLLPLQAKGVDRVDQVDVVGRGQLAQQRQRDVEVAVDLDDLRAVGDGLRQLSRRDLRLRHEDQCRDTGRGRVRGQ